MRSIWNRIPFNSSDCRTADPARPVRRGKSKPPPVPRNRCSSDRKRAWDVTNTRQCDKCTLCLGKVVIDRFLSRLSLLSATFVLLHLFEAFHHLCGNGGPALCEAESPRHHDTSALPTGAPTET